MRRLLLVLLALATLASPALLVTLASPAWAVQPDEVLSDPALEARARDLSAELRCMVCQNQSIDESDADLARDLRILLRERLTAGDSDEEVLDYLVSRYGQYVLLRPQFNLDTAILWLAPPVLLAVGGILAFAVVRRRNVRQPPAALSAEEQKRVERLLGPRPQ